MPEIKDSPPRQPESLKPKIEKFLKATGDCLSGEITPAEAFRQISNRPIEIAVPESVKTPNISPVEITIEQHQTNDEIKEIRKEIIKTSTPPENKKPTPESLVVRDEYYIQREKELLDLYGGGFIDSHKTQYEEFIETNGQKEKNISTRINSFLQKFRNQIKGRKDAQEFYTVLHQRGYSDERIIDSVKHLKKISSVEIALGIDRINKLGLKVDHFEERESIIKKAANISEEQFESVSQELNPYFFLNDLYLQSDHNGNKELYGNDMIFTLLDIAQEGKINEDVKNKLELIKAVYMISAGTDKKKLTLQKNWSNFVDVTLDSHMGAIFDKKKYHQMIFEDQGKLKFNYLNLKYHGINQKDFDSNFEIIYKNISSFSYEDKIFNKFLPEQIDKLAKKDHGIALLLSEMVKESSLPPEFATDYLPKIKDQLQSSYLDEDKSVFFFELFSITEPTTSHQKNNFIREMVRSVSFKGISFEGGKYEQLFKFINTDFGFAENEKYQAYFVFNEKKLSEFITSDLLPTSKFYETALKNGSNYKLKIPDKILSTFSEKDQSFWKAIEQQYSYGYDNEPSNFRNAAFLKLALENRNNPEFFNQDGFPTSKFYEMLVKEAGWLPPEIPQSIFSTFSESDQKFWTPMMKQLWIGSEDYFKLVKDNFSLFKIAIENRNNPEFFNQDGFPTSKLYETAILLNIDSFRYISHTILETFSPKEQQFWKLWADSSREIKLFFNQKIQELSMENVSIEELKTYGELIEKINDSPSKEIIKIKDQLILQLLKSNNPLTTYEKISDIFIKNNLPTIGKIYKIFNLLYPSKRINDSFTEKSNLSPVLTNLTNPHRREVILKDLLNIHLKSSNRSLKNYLEFFSDSGEILDKCFSGSSLSNTEKLKLSYFFGKLETLYDNSILGRREKQTKISESELQDKVKNLYQKYHVKEGQSIGDRVVELYLKSIGINSINQALEIIKNSRITTDQRNRNNFNSLIKTGIISDNSVLVKGIEISNLESILDSGSVAREYLGSNSDSDSTPFDTDTARFDENLDTKNFNQTILSLPSFKYGSLAIFVKNRGQFQDTANSSSAEYQPGKLEIFRSNVDGNNHFGVRTGIPSSEIDYITIQKPSSVDEKKLNDIFYQIAKHGAYIPVLNLNGQVIFTPQQYDEYRKSFDGISQFGGKNIEVSRVKQDSPFYKQIKDIVREKTNSGKDEVLKSDKQIKEKIRETLQELGITLRDEFDTGMVGATLHNTGSSGRNTNLPNNFDFDYALILDGPNQRKATDIYQSILSKFSYSKTKEGNSFSQVRLSEVNGVGTKLIDLDIAINNTADTLIFASHQAIEEKLKSIRNNSGQEVYEEVVANIILAKKILEENHAYKKGDSQDGGFGGIGVENWILSNGGSLEMAFKSFWKASHQNGVVIPFSEFQQKYSIRDAGENLRENGRSHDDFIFSLTEKGYSSMLKAIGKYIK